MLPNRQKQGLLLFVGIFIGIVLAILVLLFVNSKGERKPFSVRDISTTKTQEQTHTNVPYPSIKATKGVFHSFNPNTDSEKELVEAGFSPKQAKNIANYVRAGGHFSKKEDLRKLYCMNDWLYSHSSPYAIFSQKETTPPQKQEIISQKIITPHNSAYKSSLVFDLNTCDTLDLQTLKGIGSAYSRRIIMYRNKLGGYVSKEQLLEVYGMTPELYSSISSHLALKSANITKLHVNTATIKDLVHHPYINFYLAKAIIRYRTEHNGLHSLNELKIIPLMDQQTFDKLLPYLSL